MSLAAGHAQSLAQARASRRAVIQAPPRDGKESPPPWMAARVSAGSLALDIRYYFYIFGNMESKEIIAALGALAQETRLAIYRRLVEAGPAGRPAGEIALALDLAGPTLSFHLTQLHQAGLVTRRREGRSLIYAADFAAMNGLIGYLTENCCARSGADPSAVCGPSGCGPDESAASRSLASSPRRPS